MGRVGTRSEINRHWTQDNKNWKLLSRNCRILFKRCLFIEYFQVSHSDWVLKVWMCDCDCPSLLLIMLGSPGPECWDWWTMDWVVRGQLSVVLWHSDSQDVNTRENIWSCNNYQRPGELTSSCGQSWWYWYSWHYYSWLVERERGRGSEDQESLLMIL